MLAKKRYGFAVIVAAVLAGLWLFSTPIARADRTTHVATDPAVAENARLMLDEGRRVFRFETFGDEAFWGDTLKLHQAIAGSKLGGVGPGVSPKTALSVGLKVDVDAVPAAVAAALKAGKVDLDDPASTMVLLKADAVVGITGHFGSNGQLSSVGVQCAFCHSTVDDSFAAGIGHRRDGWANRDLNVGAIVSLAPDLSAYTQLLGVDEPTVRKVLASWGPGKFDAELNLDGKAFRPDGKPAATLIPPAFGLAGVNQHTWTGGWGNIPYWNAYVANLELNGRGNFLDARLDNALQYPVAAKARLGHKQNGPDMVSRHMAALDFYQLALPVPKPKPGAFDSAAASRGQVAFNGNAQCATCHVPPLFTEAGWNSHKGSEVGIDDFQSDRSPDHSYRTTPLGGLTTHAKGGFYHDGRFPDLMAVVEHYNQFLKLGLGDAEKRDLIEYLKSL
jgi:hypothetical protein